MSSRSVVLLEGEKSDSFNVEYACSCLYMCLNCAKIKFNYKKVSEQERKAFKNEQKLRRDAATKKNRYKRSRDK